jgi:hypothetical protein
MDERSDEVPDLHRRASHWYEQNGQPSQAIHHALAVGDVERAAGRGIGPPRARTVGWRGPRGRAPRLLRLCRGAAAGRAPLRRPRLFDHTGGHPKHARSPGRGAAHL